MKSFRNGSTHVSLYNEGLVVYLYDYGSSEKLRDADAAEVVVGGDVENRTERLKSIEKEHLFVAYELQGDGCPEIEIVVGEPLTGKEKKGAQWRKLQKTQISLPSGKLRVETPNSLSIGPGEPQEPGATVDIPSGDYVLSLHRLNFDKMEDSDDEFPTEVITLTPIDPGKAPEGNAKRRVDSTPAWLGWDDIMGELARWERQWKVKDGVFTGLMNGKLFSMPRTVWEKSGLRWGQRIRIEGDGFGWDAVCTGRTTFWWSASTFGRDLTDPWKEQVQGAVCPDMAMSGSTLMSFQPFDKNLEAALPKTPTKVTVRVIEPPLAPAMDWAAQRRFTREGDVLNAQVLACCPMAVTINLTWNDFKPLKITYTDRLELDFGFQKRIVYFDNLPSEPSIWHARSEIAAIAFKDIHDEILERDPDFYVKETYLRDWEARTLDFKFDKMAVPSEIGSRLSLKAKQMSHWEAYGFEMLWLQPVLGTDTHLDVPVGTPVAVRIVR